jgi:hypothetical protein
VSAIAETEIGDVRVAREAPDVKLDDAGRQDVLKSGRVSVYTVAWSTLAMAAATGLGALPFFFLELEAQWAGLCNGMAAGVMLAASFDLVQEGQMYGSGSWVVFGILSGGVFIWLCKKVHLASCLLSFIAIIERLHIKLFYLQIATKSLYTRKNSHECPPNAPSF